MMATPAMEFRDFQADALDLAKMRDDEIVSFRRDGQAPWYRIADLRIEQLIAELHRLFCRAIPAT